MKLGALDDLLARHRLRVAYRTDDQWGGRAAQDKYLRELGSGGREADGGRREWVTDRRIELFEGREDGEEPVSSTRVREAVRNGDSALLRRLVTDGVAEWILEEGLYMENK